MREAMTFGQGTHPVQGNLYSREPGGIYMLTSLFSTIQSPPISYEVIMGWCQFSYTLICIWLTCGRVPSLTGMGCCCARPAVWFGEPDNTSSRWAVLLFTWSFDVLWLGVPSLPGSRSLSLMVIYHHAVSTTVGYIWPRTRIQNVLRSPKI